MMEPTNIPERDGTNMADKLFETDDGFIAHPLLGGRTISRRSHEGVVLGLHYATTPEELRTGKGQSIHVRLKPQQALQLAEALMTHAQRVLKRPARKMH
jgi:hypothetical protein